MLQKFVNINFTFREIQKRIRKINKQTVKVNAALAIKVLILLTDVSPLLLKCETFIVAMAYPHLFSFKFNNNLLVLFALVML